MLLSVLAAVPPHPWTSDTMRVIVDTYKKSFDYSRETNLIEFEYNEPISLLAFLEYPQTVSKVRPLLLIFLLKSSNSIKANMKRG